LKIDWRGQINTLEPYLESRGGVLGVGGGPTSAYESFITLMVEEFETRHEGNKCVRLIPGYLATRTASDIISLLEEELGIEYAPPADPSVNVNVNVASRIRSLGRVDIKNIENRVSVSPASSASNQVKRTERIIATVRERLQTCRLALILDGCPDMPTDSFMWFWQQLWKRGLKALPRKGLLVLCGSITSNGNYQHRAPAQVPEKVITLPAQYDDANYLHALEDLSGLLAGELAESLEEARIRAQTLLISTWSLLPEQVYNNLYTEILKLKRGIEK
jgi:hypothetical protein